MRSKDIPDAEYDPKLYQFVDEEGSKLEIVIDTHIFTSWPNADVEKFIEASAAVEDREARIIHLRDRIEGGFISILGTAMTLTGVKEFVDTHNPMYLLGSAVGIGAVVFGVSVPHSSYSNQTQQSYRDTATAIRNMPRQILEEE